MRAIDEKFLKSDKDSGNILESMLHAQELEGYLSKEMINVLAEKYEMTPSKVYETASFYSMIRTKPEGLVRVEVCRSGPCHVTGAREVVAAVEENLGIKAGETSADGQYSFKYCECLGHCQAGPTLLINGTLHDHLTPADVDSLIKEAAETV